MSSLFKRFGVPVTAAIVLGLAGLGGYLWWENNQKAAIAQRGEDFTMALDKIDPGGPDGPHERP